MGSIFARSEEVQLTNTTQNIAPNTHTDGVGISSFVGNVSRILYDEGICLVDSDIMGESARIPYDPASGIREGGACKVSVFYGIPRVTGCVNFGNEEMFLCDPTGEFEEDVFFKVGKPTTSKGKGEEATGDSSGILHKDGEKVLACDFSGIKAAQEYAVLFYEANAKVICSDGIAGVYGDDTVMFSRGGFITIDEPLNNQSSAATGTPLGRSNSSVFELDDDGNKFFSIVREYKGDVAGAMAADNLKIDRLISSDGFSLSKSVYAMIIIDRDVEKYKRNVQFVSHTYINRKLKVKGSTGANGTFHNEFSDSANIKKKDVESFAIIGKVNSEEVAITYLKAISIDGQVYEFSAKNHIEVRNDEKKVVSGISKQYNAGRIEHYFQDTWRTIQYPIREDTITYREVFSIDMRVNKGMLIDHFHEQWIKTLIHTQTIYEVDKKSDIETLEFKNSPIILTLKTEETNIHEKHEDLSLEPILQHTFKTDDVTIQSMIQASKGYEFLNYISSGNDSAHFMFGTAGINYESKNGYTYFKSRLLNVESEYNIFKGPSSFEEIIVDGDMYVTARNIVLSADEYIVTTSMAMYSSVEKGYSISYSDYFYVSNVDSSGVREDGTPKTVSMLYLSDFTSYLAGELTIAYGGETIYAWAKENGAFGAKTASFFGGRA